MLRQTFTAVAAIEPVIAPARVDTMPTANIITTLQAALGACHVLLTLHFDDADEASIVLGQTGEMASDPALRNMILDHARDVHIAASGLSGRPLERDWLALVPGVGQVCALSFPCRRGQSRILCTIVHTHGHERGPKALAAALKPFLPFLEACCEAWQARRHDARRNRAVEAALDLVDLGVILVDRDASLVFANACATTALEPGKLLRRRGRTISANMLADTIRLQAAMATAIAQNLDEGGLSATRDEPTLLRLNAGNEQLIVAVVPVDRRAREPGDAAAMLVVLDPWGQQHTVTAPICRLYGLSPVETRLACHIVAGRSLHEACEAMRVKEQTARSYLKQIFMKTNVNRQADLIRLLMSSLVRMRAGGAVRAI